VAKVLIVDDDPDFCEATRRVLEKEKHEVVTAAGGNEGLERVKRDQPDLVILDVIMDTVLDGLAASLRMHDDPALRHVPVIMVTSIASTEYAEMFPTDEYVHVNAFLSKPVKPAELIRQVNRCLPPA
jgi:CheY-like chemotaxis protein